MKISYVAEYLVPGSLVSEEYYKHLETGAVSEALQKMPEKAFGFRILTKHTLYGTLEDGSPISNTKTVSETGMYYPDGRLYSPEEVKALGPGYEILLSNMESNDYHRVVKTRRGNWQPFNAGDYVI